MTDFREENAKEVISVHDDSQKVEKIISNFRCLSNVEDSGMRRYLILGNIPLTLASFFMIY